MIKNLAAKSGFADLELICHGKAKDPPPATPPLASRHSKGTYIITHS